MFEVKIMTKDGKEFTPIMFDTIEEAIECFKNNDKLGLQVALYNFK